MMLLQSGKECDLNQLSAQLNKLPFGLVGNDFQIKLLLLKKVACCCRNALHVRCCVK